MFVMIHEIRHNNNGWPYKCFSKGKVTTPGHTSVLVKAK